jgi:adenylate cyclase
MGLLDDLKGETEQIVRAAWKPRDGVVVPETDSVGLGNESEHLEAPFLYADLADSTELAIQSQNVAAEVFKAYLMGTARIIRSMGGEIRSFDGDRVMGVFIEGPKNTAAVEAGLKISYVVRKILEPAFTGFYPSMSLSLHQTVGVDTSQVMVVRSGIRNSNDLVWVGRAPNVAAKLSAIREGYDTYITKSVFDAMLDTCKYGGDPKRLMWESRTWAAGKPYGVEQVHRSHWTWTP